MSEASVGVGKGSQGIRPGQPHDGGRQTVGELVHRPHGDSSDQVAHTGDMLVQARRRDSQIGSQPASGRDSPVTVARASTKALTSILLSE